MSLNPFEQLEFFVPEPKLAFNETVELLLQGKFGASAVNASDGPGRIRVTGALPGSPEGATVYQAKYFLKRWCSFKRQQIRESFQQTAEQEGPAGSWRWVLCVPAALAPGDRRWFEHWKEDRPAVIECLAGPDLLRLLLGPGGRRALEQLRACGVTVPRADSTRLQGRLRIHPAAPNHHPAGALSHYLYVSLFHGGHEPLTVFEVELAHSPTRCLSLRPDERDWREQMPGGSLARKWQACRPLLPGEERLLAVIPVGFQTPWPLDLRLMHVSPDRSAVEAHLRLESAALGAAGPFDFMPGPQLFLTQSRRISAPAA